MNQPNIDQRWREGIPTLGVATAAKLLGTSPATLRARAKAGTIDALQWHDNTWRISARAVAAELHRRHGVHRVPGNTMFGNTLVDTLEAQTLRLAVHMGVGEPRATLNNDGTLQQLYTVPFEERRFHDQRLREMLPPAAAPTTRTTKVEHLSEGDRIEAAFPTGTTTAQAACLAADGWLIVDTSVIDYPQRARHEDGTPLNETDVAQRHPFTITDIKRGHRTAQITLTLPGGTTCSRHLGLTTTVRTLP